VCDSLALDDGLEPGDDGGRFERTRALARCRAARGAGRVVRLPSLLRGRGVKLALVTQSYYPRFGGVTEHVEHSARELRARGHEVTIVTGARPAIARPIPKGVVRLGTSIMVPFQGAFVDLTLGRTCRRELSSVVVERACSTSCTCTSRSRPPCRS
jgi:hypothetical protein